ncbi:polysaccharide deacetylase [Luteitalea sp. TBR-22]|uniref:polysaccharide deacetylase family protein n=1 Tax=Luteitalea sp. TBR-22 TaxID=2802971 RepID=UPI001AF641FD|nr:polysaccharide deacetylase family protein [Luteitalea sp. TBR-22]BCS33211.1 polysaccharide deacetylase [Luteitalea sp. TBR-22]
MSSALSRVRRALAPAAKTLLLRTGGFRALRSLSPSRGVAILRYHAVCGPEGYAYADPGICVSPEAFDAHIAYLSAQYAVLPLPEAVARIREKRPLPPNAVAITFDDGYADNLGAARTLHKYGVVGTFYLTADCLADGQPFWPTEIKTLVDRLPGPSVTVRTPRELTLPLVTSDDRYRAIKAFTKLCKGNLIPVREQLRTELRELAGMTAAPTPTMLTWEQVREMVRLGMDMGGHTLTHANLPSAGPEAAWQEIDGCRRALRERLGVEVTQFSYPNGGAELYHTEQLHRMVERAGFTGAATSSNGFATLASDPYAMERVEIEERLEDLVFALEVERFAFRPAPRAAAPQT